jgi:hypothetical protein
MDFDHCNCSLKIWESIEIPTPKVGVHLGVWRFSSPTLPYSQPPGSMKCDSRASLLAHAFASPYFGHEPKARVTTVTLGFLVEMLSLLGITCKIQLKILKMEIYQPIVSNLIKFNRISF